MKKQLFIGLVGFLVLFGTSFPQAYATSTPSSSGVNQDTGSEYTTLRDVDKGTYNEYRYYMVREYFKLREHYDLNYSINATIANNLLRYANTGYNYLPDSLINQNLLSNLTTSIQRGIRSPNSELYYNEIVKTLADYIENVNIPKIQGTIEATPTTGNAPLNTTLRGRITDPTGAIIPSANYIWWTTQGGKRVILGRGPSINFTFREEGNYTVFLDVKSAHKNSAGFTDVLSFQSRAIVQVKEKIASVIIKVNTLNLGNSDELKFTPDESSYGLIFDATSSTPTGGSRFARTEWDFGNGVIKRYDGSPRIERVIYSQEGNYNVNLKLYTNEGRMIERKFTIFIHKPIASIVADKTDGYIGEKFSFSTISSVNQRNLAFTWNVIDIGSDKIIKQHTGNVFSHSFSEKGRYNIQLKVKDAAGNEDVDTKIIHINSRAPVAVLNQSVPNRSKPNTLLLDATKSYDLDFSDVGKLRYRWTINGNLVNLDYLDSAGGIGYYTFDTVGDHDIVLEVLDPDEMSSVITQKIKIDSILDVELATFPRVIQRGGFIRFVANSSQARIYEWDFGDGNRDAGTDSSVNHIYQKSGIYTVKLIVRDVDGKTNETTKTVYVGESNSPFAHIGIDYGNTEIPDFDQTGCEQGAYIIDRTKTVSFKGGESLDINGELTGLTYSWKIGYDKFISGRDTTYRFTELGCFPVKLTVRSDKNGATHTTDTWVRVQNLKPTLSSLDISVQNQEADPVIVSVVANGAQDPDGVIQSYLWYYYTDTDPDPQDFRSTIVPNTTFVIPKITGNYYFVVVMRDNNDERFSSENLSDSKYFITLSGDNINTPLVDFRVNKSSVMVSDDVVFNASAKNVLGQDITSKAEYAWDFDGDGFYDVETKEPTVEHKYQTSGTFYAKVRVKYKGMTNVRTIEMNVSNVLEPDFEYTSIGDTFIFYNTSRGKVDSVVWNLGDGTTIYDKNYFTYTYEDGKPTHQVEVRITEGTKVRNKTLTVTKNMRNLLQSRNAEGIVIHAFPEVQEEKIILQTQDQKVYLYLGESKGDFTHYGIDFDINIDSDLNGGKDDDIDNKNDGSYTTGAPVEVILNDSKTQVVRIMLLRADGSVVDSQDITLEKEFIQEQTIDIDTIRFEGVTDGERVKIEQLKTFIQGLPQEFRLKGMQYVQQLQESWFYPVEKTKIILEFSGFIDGTGVNNAFQINTLLESLLVEGQEDQSVRNMAYNVIKNLIPQELVEYDTIIGNLDIIAENPAQIEENKVFGKEILELIKDTSLITNDDKLTIKNQLQVFIYGSVENIPVEVQQEVKQEQSLGDNKVVGLFSNVITIIGWILGCVVVIIIGFFLWFKISNKNESQGLQDFIIEKTSFDKDPNDILSSTPIVPPVPTPKPSVTPGVTPKVPEINTISRPKTEVKEELSSKKESVPSVQKEEKVPDWLAGAIGKVSNETSSDTKVEEKAKEEPLVKTEKVEPLPDTKVEEEKVPAWLAGALGESAKETPKAKEEAKSEEKAKEEPLVKTEKVEPLPETKVEEEKVPAWLAGALGESAKETPKAKEEAKEEPLVKTEKVEPLPETKIEEEKVPAWLAGALDVNQLAKNSSPEEPKKASDKKPKLSDEEIKSENKADEKPKKSSPKLSKVEEKTGEEKKVVKKTTSKIETEQELKPNTKKSESKTTQSGTTSTSDELWNDGMDIPDWLKPESSTSKKEKKDDIWTIDAIKTDDESDDDTKK